MGEALEVAKVLVEPATKLIDVVQSAIGKAYEPRHIRKMADARAYEIATVSSAMREASDIPIVYSKGELSLDTTDFDAFIKRTQNRMAYQELQKQYNIETISNKAYTLLEGEDKVPNDPLDVDWVNRLFNYAGDISNEKMQEIWAAILAGEVKRPTSFSLRTLETLHNISQSEAELFQKLSPFFIYNRNNIYFPNYKSLFSLANVDYSDFLRLDECGLINSSPSLHIKNSVVEQPIGERFLLEKNSSYVLTAISNSSNNQRLIINDGNLIINSFPLTSSGIEIAKLFNTSTNDDFFIAFASEVKRKNLGIKIELFKIVKETPEGIEYTDDNPIDI